MSLSPGSPPTAYRGRPRFDGANISTFIGFRNFMSLAEDAVLTTFREAGAGPQALFEQHGLGLEVVDSSTRLVGTMHVDDVVTGLVTPVEDRHGNGLSFKVRLDAERPHSTVPLLNGRLTVAVIAEKDGTGPQVAPPELARLVQPEVPAIAGLPEAQDPVRPANGFSWRWTVPYYSCHYYTRLQSNAYVRLLEETVDRYLTHAGLPITELLGSRDWIPVVSRARVQMTADAHMGETLIITFAVDDVLKDSLFTARMDCHVQRGGVLVRTATATIMHGYVLARGDRAFDDLVQLDEATQTRLRNG